MLPKRDGIPGAAVLDPRYSVQLAPCTVCGHTLDVSIPPFAIVAIGGHEAVVDGERVYVPRREVQVSGVTIYRCPKCKTVETEAMRAAQRLSRVAPERPRTCAHPACDTAIPESRRYCSRDCHTAHQVAERAARLAALRAERTCARPGCGATFVRRPKSVTDYCSRACAISHDWEQRNPPETREDRAKQRRRVALKAWRTRQRAKRQEVAA